MSTIADMMDRPPFGDWDVYTGAYIVGFVPLCAVAWFVVRRCKSRSSRAAVLSTATIIAVVAGMVLREAYHVSRAETCFRFLLGAAQRGDEHGALIGYGRGGGRLVSIGPGFIITKYGTPPELVAYLKRKYDGWFSGAIVACRHRAVGLTAPNAEDLVKVQTMPVPQTMDEQLER